jgi:ABC-type branched-subunit amino acid transport system substrate-binding protein
MTRPGSHFVLAALAVIAGLPGCGHDRPAAGDPGSVHVVVFQDGSLPDALELVSPSVLALQLALEEAIAQGRLPPGSGIRVVDTAGDPTVAVEGASRAAADATVVAAFVAPLWRQPVAAADILAAAGVATLSASSMDEPPSVGAWHRLVPSDPDLAGAVARASTHAARGAPVCVAGEERFAARSSAVSAVLGDGAFTVGPLVADVVDGVAEHACGAVAWAGSTEGALDVRRTLDGAGHTDVTLVGFETVKTERFLQEGFPHVQGTLTVSGCADVSVADDPQVQRFVHDYQAATGLDPGLCALEGYDAGDVIARLRAAGRRGGAGASPPAGHLGAPHVRMYVATGVRWIGVRGCARAEAKPSERPRQRCSFARPGL